MGKRGFGTELYPLMLHVAHVFFMFCRYFLELLKAYAALQRFKPKLHADAVPLEVSALGPDRNLTMADRTCNVCI